MGKEFVRVWVLAACVAFFGCGGDDGDGTTAPQPPGPVGSGPTYNTPEQLMGAAPPTWRPTSTNKVTHEEVSFLAPQSWETTVYTDGVGVRSPQDGGAQCEIFVLAPRATAAAGARYDQLLAATQALFAQGTQLEDQYGGGHPLEDRLRGVTGRGWDYVGLRMSVDQSIEVLSILADFGGTAVPMVIIEPRSSTWECIDFVGDFGIHPATVFHTLSVAGFTPAGPNALAASIIGRWFSSDGITGSQYIFGANGQYIDSSVYGGSVETSPGDWNSVYATWTGTGSYQVVGDVVGFFPTGAAASSRFARHYEWVDGQGVWHRTLCTIGSYDRSPYTLCQGYSAE
jgi:hypothetical protein